MKCNKVVIFAKNKRGKKELQIGCLQEEGVKNFVSIYAATYKDLRYEKCTGKIVCEIKAVEEPFFGGTYAIMEVYFRCQKCGGIVGGLPNDEDSLNKWVQKLLDEMK